MTAPIELEETHKYLRNKLDILGFHYPLPIGAISLVGALVDDLIKTTESLRAAKDEVINLREEKEAWDLGVEPYKCDNSRLLAECNALHQDLLKEREKSDIKLLEITRALRNLELDKKYLEEHCAELNKKLREFESKYLGDASKRNKDSANMHKKPFVTAVRSGKLISNPNMPTNKDKSCFKLVCHCQKRLNAPPTSCTDLQRLENDYRDARDTLETVQRQMDAKEREIQRLTNLLQGGRTPAQLARECCYKGIHDLSKDLELLQKEKNKLQSELNVSIAAQHEAMQRATMLEEKNRELECETDVLEKTALEVESKANMALDEKNREIAELQKQMNNLRRQPEITRVGNNVDNEKAVLKSEIKQINDEYRTLVDKLNECSKVVQNLQTDNQKLSKKNSKLKAKLSNLKETVEIPKEFQDNNKPTESKKHDDVQELLSDRLCEEELARIRKERDYYQKEYQQILENRHSHENLDALQNELKDKNLLIRQLRNDIELLKNSKSSAISASQSVHATIHRLERERDALKLEIQKLCGERNALQEKTQILTERQVSDHRQHASQLQDLYKNLSRLEMEKSQILSSQVPTETAVNLLGSEIEELKQKLQQSESENQQLKTRYNQIKVLQEQTERTLTEQHSKLVMAECIKGRIESKLNTLDSNREEAEKQVDTLKSNLLKAKTTVSTLEREKDKCMIELDGKTERLFKLEADLRTAEKDKRELQKSLDAIKKLYDEKNLERISQQGTLRDVTTESNTLRKQISTLKHYNDNAMLENNRLTNELGDSVTELTIVKRKLKDSEMEVEKLKIQLQQYVQEVKRVEDMLANKENEREEMLDHFRSLSHDAVVLEGNNHSLEIEAAETKKQLLDAENKIIDLEAVLQIKNSEIRSYEKQINDLSAQIGKLELELEAKCEQNALIQADLGASKDLIDKLDLQKDKLIDELNEHSTIRQQLQSENNNLKSEINVLSGGTSERKNRMNELLESSRQEIDQHIRNSNVLNQEVIKLRRKTDELQNQLASEQTNSARNVALAHEYSVQLQELRQVLTNERFDSLHSKDDMDKNQSPRSSVSNETKESLYDSDEVVSVNTSPSRRIENNIANEAPPSTHKSLSNFTSVSKKTKENVNEILLENKASYRGKETNNIVNKSSQQLNTAFIEKSPSIKTNLTTRNSVSKGNKETFYDSIEVNSISPNRRFEHPSTSKKSLTNYSAVSKKTIENVNEIVLKNMASNLGKEKSNIANKSNQMLNQAIIENSPSNKTSLTYRSLASKETKNNISDSDEIVLINRSPGRDKENNNANKSNQELNPALIEKSPSNKTNLTTRNSESKGPKEIFYDPIDVNSVNISPNRGIDHNIYNENSSTTKKSLTYSLKSKKTIENGNEIVLRNTAPNRGKEKSNIVNKSNQILNQAIIENSPSNKTSLTYRSLAWKETKNSISDSDEIVSINRSPGRDKENNNANKSNHILNIPITEKSPSNKKFENDLKISSTVRKDSKKLVPTINLEKPSNEVIEILGPRPEPELSIITPVEGHDLYLNKPISATSTSTSVDNQNDLSPVSLDSPEPELTKPKKTVGYDFSSLPPPPPIETIDFVGTRCNLKLHVFAIAGQLDKFNINCVIKK